MDCEDVCVSYYENGVPVLTPTFEQFKYFHAFIHQLEKQRIGENVGICKVIPPPEFLKRLESLVGGKDDKAYLKKCRNKVIYEPIRQNVYPCALASSQSGIYEFINEVEHENSSVYEFNELALRRDKVISKKIGVSPDSFSLTEEQMDSLEKMYWDKWKTAGGFGGNCVSGALYGADLSGSFFPTEELDAKSDIPWNMNRLGTFLDLLKDIDGSSPQGVVSPYLYFGQWMATFCWHTEDMDLFSMNYIHYGRGKQWYCIPPSYSTKFESVARKYFPRHFAQCSQFLRHKSVLIHSEYLCKKEGIPVYRCRQNEHEFIITLPRSYHSGFNFGRNCAEAVNFATEGWIGIGEKADVCDCVDDSVHINMPQFIAQCVLVDRAEEFIEATESETNKPLLITKNGIGEELDEVVEESDDDTETLLDTNNLFKRRVICGAIPAKAKLLKRKKLSDL